MREGRSRRFACLSFRGLIAIPYSYVHPFSFVQTNVVGTANILNACLEAGVERLITTSTSEVYGTAVTDTDGRNHRLHPQSPYAASKASADHLAESYAHDPSICPL